MKNVMIVDRWEDLKLLLSPARKEIIDKCILSCWSLKELADNMNLNPSSVHNHLTKLYKANFLIIEERSIINGIEEKKYRSVAKDFVLNRSLLLKNSKITSDISKAVQKESLSILNGNNLILSKYHRVFLSKSNFKIIKKKINELESLILSSNGSGDVLSSFVLVAGELDERK